jgi:DNA-binding winged helix-turn-helix (wHTH) protein
MRSLRSKIEADPERPTCIRTVGDIGYRFDLPESDVCEGLAASGNRTDR